MNAPLKFETGKTLAKRIIVTNFCFVCGCTQFDACPGGCYWKCAVVSDFATVLVCSRCWERFKGMVDKADVAIAAPRLRARPSEFGPRKRRATR